MANTKKHNSKSSSKKSQHSSRHANIKKGNSKNLVAKHVKSKSKSSSKENKKINSKSKSNNSQHTAKNKKIKDNASSSLKNKKSKKTTKNQNKKNKTVVPVIPNIEGDLKAADKKANTWSMQVVACESFDLKNNTKLNSITVDPATNPHPPKKRISPRRKQAIRNVIITSFVLVLVIGSVLAAYAYSLFNTSFEDEDSEAIHEQLTEAKINEPFYMLLIGTDTREKEGTYSLDDGRSDTCILTRIDPVNFKVTMVSIPRDTKITNNGRTEKFNSCYNYGGVAATIAQVKKLCNVEVAHYAEISFKGLKDMVNAVGGVEIDVPNNISDSNAGGSISKGPQTLNGEQALIFSRSRKFADGDFTRTADQRLLIQALINKAFKLPVSDMPNVLKVAKNFIKTDLTLAQMLGLATQFKEADQLTIYSAMIPSTTGSEGGASYVIVDKAALRRQMKMVEKGEDPSLVEVSGGAAVGSSRDAEDVKKRQKEYYAINPDSPGRIANDTSDSTSYDYEYSDTSTSNSSSNSTSNSTSKSSSKSSSNY